MDTAAHPNLTDVWVQVSGPKPSLGLLTWIPIKFEQVAVFMQPPYTYMSCQNAAPGGSGWKNKWPMHGLQA